MFVVMYQCVNSLFVMQLYAFVLVQTWLFTFVNFIVYGVTDDIHKPLMRGCYRLFYFSHTRFGTILTFIRRHVATVHPTWLILMEMSCFEETLITIISFG